MDDIEKNNEDKVFNIIFEVFAQNKLEDIQNEMNFLRSRLSIISFKELSKLSKQKQEQYVQSLIEDEANQTTCIFVKKIIDNDLIKYILGNNFDHFLNEFEDRTKNKGEILFISAINLTPDFQEKISRLLRTKYPQVLRTVFLKDPELIAGFKIILLEKEFDYSLKSNGPKLIYQKIKGII